MAHIKIVLSGIEIETRIPISKGPIPIGAFLPIARAFTEIIIQGSCSVASENGKKVSCSKGCSACCGSQLVPVALGEACEIHKIVESMTEPMRSKVLARFQNGLKQLRDAGLLEKMDMTRGMTDEEIENDSTRYMNLRIPCPFLENQICFIYADRPLICREFLVSSDPEFCRNPAPETVHTIPLAAHASRALMHLDDLPGIDSLRWIPLICALDWVRENPEPAPRAGTDLLSRFLELLGKEPKP